MIPNEALSTTFSALGDPTRLAILARLADGESTVSELAEPFEMSMPAITKHLKVLENAGLIERGKRAQWRPCRINATPLKAANEWLEQYREIWEANFNRLDHYLQEMQQKKKGKRKHK